MTPKPQRKHKIIGEKENKTNMCPAWKEDMTGS
jgi:hypothetical protein